MLIKTDKMDRMEPIEQHFQEHLDRIDRLLKIIMADDPQELCGDLRYFDIVIFACQCMWHLRDWLKYDVHFGAASWAQVNADIHSEKCLLICSDLANGTKHLKLSVPKTGLAFSGRTGIHVDRNAGICQVFYHISGPDSSDPYYGMEIRDLLQECRASWDRIINKHFLSAFFSNQI